MLHVSEETQASQNPSEIPWLVNPCCCTLLLNSCCRLCFKNATISCLSEASQSHTSCSTEIAVYPSNETVKIHLFFAFPELYFSVAWSYYSDLLSLCLISSTHNSILHRPRTGQNKARIIFSTVFDCRTMLCFISQIKFLLCNFQFLVTDYWCISSFCTVRHGWMSKSQISSKLLKIAKNVWHCLAGSPHSAESFIRETSLKAKGQLLYVLYGLVSGRDSALLHSILVSVQLSQWW